MSWSFSSLQRGVSGAVRGGGSGEETGGGHVRRGGVQMYP